MIYEILRLTTPTPLSVPHYCYKDFKLAYKNKNGKLKHVVIPKGCNIYSNLIFTQKYDNSNNNNNNKWDVGQGNSTFVLSNFLKENGQFYQNPNFAVFGKGKRLCIGKKLAIQTLSIVIGTLITQFEFSEAPIQHGGTLIQQVWGITSHCTPTAFVVRRR